MQLQDPKANEVMKLQRGQTYTLAKPLTLASGVNVIATGSGKPPVIHWSGPDWQPALSIPAGINHVTVDGIAFDLGTKNPATDINGGNVTLRNCVVLKGHGLAQLAGAHDVLIDHCEAAGLIDRNFVYAGGGKDNNRITLRNCTVRSSHYEHCVRFHSTHDLTIEHCVFDNTGSTSGKQTINLRDGSNHNVFNCVLRGPSVIGPLADDNGGIKDPPGADRDRKLALRLQGVSLKNCEFQDYVILEAGLSGLHVEVVSIKALHGGGYCFSCSPTYGPRQPATGGFNKVTWSGKALLSGKHDGIATQNITHI